MKRILILDHDLAITDYLSQELPKKGESKVVRACTKATEVLMYLNLYGADIVLMDHRHIKDSTELLLHIIIAHPNVKVVLYSDSMTIEEIEHFEVKGIARFLSKENNHLDEVAQVLSMEI